MILMPFYVSNGLALLFLYIPMLKGYFHSDDVQIIWLSATKSAVEMFFTPEGYRALSGANFTPLLWLSFKIDYLLFDLNPIGYMFHNLLAVWLMTVAFYFLLRLFVSNILATIGATSLILNPVVFSIFTWSSSRHYIEGAVFCLISLIFFIKKDKEGKYSLLSGFFYLFSALCKEVYVILPLLVFVFVKGDLRERLYKTSPMIVGGVIYTVWRIWILGGIGGYPFVGTEIKKGIFNDVINIIRTTQYHIVGEWYLLFWILFLIALFVLKDKKNLIKALVIAALLLAPILPVSWVFGNHYMTARYALHFSLFFTFLVVLGAEKVKTLGSVSKISLIIVLFFVVFVFYSRDRTILDIAMAERSIAEKSAREFVYDKRHCLEQVQPSWFYEGLRDIYRYVYLQEIETLVVPSAEMRKYAIGEGRARLENCGYELMSEKRSFVEADIVETLKVEGYTLKWKVRPALQGVLYVMTGRHDGLYYDGLWAIKREGSYNFGMHYPEAKQPLVMFVRFLLKTTEGKEYISSQYKVEIPEGVKTFL